MDSSAADGTFDVVSFRRVVREILDHDTDEKATSTQLLAVIANALKFHPNSSRLYSTYADACFLSDPNGTDAVTNHLRALELDPLNSEAYESLGYIYDANSDYAKAETCFRKALAAQERIDSFLGLASVLAAQNKPQEASSVLTEATNYVNSQSQKIENKRAEVIDN